MKNVLFVLCFLSCGPAAASADAADRPPNIIFILADDLGIGNVGCYGADHYQTPHLDALAGSGLRYERAYTAPLCGPSRALIMTGRYAFLTGALMNISGSVAAASIAAQTGTSKPMS